MAENLARSEIRADFDDLDKNEDAGFDEQCEKNRHGRRIFSVHSRASGQLCLVESLATRLKYIFWGATGRKQPG